MSAMHFSEGVKPGGLTSGQEIRILLCYLLANTSVPITRAQLEDVLLGEELVNYFALAESLAQLREQELVEEGDDGYKITEKGRTVGQTLAQDVPRTIRDTAVRGMIRAQQYAAKAAVNKSEVLLDGNGRMVHCSIGDQNGALFDMQLYMPDELSAGAVRDQFIEHGDIVYKLVLTAMTGNEQLARQALDELLKK